MLFFLFQVNDEPRPAIHEEKNETERGKNCFYSCNWSNCECVFLFKQNGKIKIMFYILEKSNLTKADISGTLVAACVTSFLIGLSIAIGGTFFWKNRAKIGLRCRIRVRTCRHRLAIRLRQRRRARARSQQRNQAGADGAGVSLNSCPKRWRSELKKQQQPIEVNIMQNFLISKQTSLTPSVHKHIKV